MNAEIIKAMNRKNEKHPIRDWWKKNGRKVVRVTLFPVWVLDRLNNKWYAMKDAKHAWSDERVNEILNYYVPRKCSWNEEEQELYFFDGSFAGA